MHSDDLHNDEYCKLLQNYIYKLSKGMLCADGCGALQCRLYDRPPEVFTLQLAWQTNSARKPDIKAAMLGLREVRLCSAHAISHGDACSSNLKAAFQNLLYKVTASAAIYSLKPVNLQELDISDMHAQLHPGKHVCHLHNMVCYNAQHYMAFISMPDGTWHAFDDARITHIGLWPDVVRKCTDGRIQASVMFYHKPWSAYHVI